MGTADLKATIHGVAAVLHLHIVKAARIISESKRRNGARSTARAAKEYAIFDEESLRATEVDDRDLQEGSRVDDRDEVKQWGGKGRSSNFRGSRLESLGRV